MKKLFYSLVLVFSSLFLFTSSVFAQEAPSAEVFYSKACSDCGPYLKDVLVPALNNAGFNSVAQNDYIGHPEFRAPLDNKIKEWQIPNEMIGHMMTFVDLGDGKKVLLAGHVPKEMLDNLLSHEVHHFDSSYFPLGIWQDEMHGEVKNYKVWTQGKVAQFDIKTPLSTAITETGNKTVETGNPSASSGQAFLLPTVLVSGFLDGLNPCAFAVLLFLIAFIFMLKKARLQVLLFGLVYVAAIYLAYLLIGLGLWRITLFTGAPHFMAKLGSVLVILLGLINVKDYVAPKLFPFTLRLPFMARLRLMDYMHKGTLPATFILGFLVGLCTFPCSGGIYVAIVSLLASKVTFTLGFIYLLIYNLMFVSPLLIILGLAGNRFVTEKLTNVQEKSEPKMRLAYGLIMIAIGVGILVFFV